uniref:Reverse transcriptase zinc-binding domain-containing protein n=1 Tax=Oryza meridionalis TaxID=40149 RepID=A0A0E0ENF5_9ORYZ
MRSRRCSCKRERRMRQCRSGLFTPASAYNLFFMVNTEARCCSLIWHTRLPSKVKFFKWLADKGRCLMADNLSKRGWPHQQSCPLCMTNDEDCKHLFVWRRIKGWIDARF